MLWRQLWLFVLGIVWVFLSTAHAFQQGYVSNPNGSYVAVIGEVIGEVKRLATGGTPINLAARPDGKFVYVLLGTGVGVIDTATNGLRTVIPTLTGGSNPEGNIAFSPDGSRAYVTHPSAQRVVVLDATNHSEVTQIPLSIGTPVNLAVRPDGEFLYVLLGGNGVAVIDTSTNGVRTIIPTSTGGNNPDGHIVFSPDGTRAYVSNPAGNYVAILDATNHTEIARVTVSIGNPVNLAVRPDGRFVYALIGGNGIAVIDAETNGLRTLIPTPAGGNNPDGNIAFGADGTRAYVTNPNANYVAVLDTTNHVEVTRIAMPSGNAINLAVRPAGDFAFVLIGSGIAVIDTATNGIRNVVPTPTGGSNPDGHIVFLQGTGTAYVSNPNGSYVAVIGEVIGEVKRLATGGTPINLAARPDGKFVYVLLGTGVGVIDTATNGLRTVIPTLTGGSNPEGNIAFSPDGSRAYVTHPSAQRVVVLDATNHSEVTQIPLSIGTPVNLAVRPDGEFLYVLLGGNGVAVIDTSTNGVRTIIPTSTGGNNPDGHIVFSPDGTRAYVSNPAGNYVAILDATNHTEIARVTVSIGNPVNLAVRPDGRFVYALIGGNGIAVIDAETNGLRTLIPTPAGGNNPDGNIAFGADGTRAYVTNPNANYVAVLDTTNHVEVTRIAMPSGNAINLAVRPAGDFAFVLIGSGIAVIDTATNGIRNVVPTPTGGSNPDGHIVFLPCKPTPDNATHQALLGLATLKLYPFDASIQLTRQSATRIQLTWNAPLNRFFLLQSSPSLVAPEWFPILGVVPGTGASLTFQDDTDAHATRFYRLLSTADCVR